MQKEKYYNSIPVTPGTDFQIDLYGLNGEKAQKLAEKKIEGMKTQVDSGEILVDEDGAAYWKESGNYLSGEPIEVLCFTKFPFSAGNTLHKSGVVTWKDLVRINDKIYAEEFPIENVTDKDKDGCDIYRVDMFMNAVAEKHGCNVNDITTWFMDGDDFDEGADMPKGYIKSFPFGAEDCGPYINGEPEGLFRLRYPETHGVYYYGYERGV